MGMTQIFGMPPSSCKQCVYIWKQCATTDLCSMRMQFSAHLSSRYHAASPHGFSRTSMILLVLTTRNVEMSTIMCAGGKRTPPDGQHNNMHDWCGLEIYLLRETNDKDMILGTPR